MARTADNDMSNPQPFFPHQCRVSALHLLVHMIATLMRFSTPRVVDRLHEKAFNLVRALRPFLSRRDSR
jgi:hypothetical protein